MVEEEKVPQVDALEELKGREEDVVKAKEELSKLDVLVCGECHEIFHFVEEFTEHRAAADKCAKQSTLIESIQNDKHIQIWGFMLWKNAKFKAEKTPPPSSWNVYQLWCNLEQPSKDSWIAAGKALQNLHGIYGTTKGAVVVGKQKRERPKGASSVKEEEDDSERTENEHDALGDTESDADVDESTKGKHKEGKVENGGLQKVGKATVLNKEAAGPPRALRMENNKKIERGVERLLSKRYNPGKKTHEFFVKWATFPEEQNSWEPIGNLSKCKQLIDDFEKNLAELKAAKLPKGTLVQRRPYRKHLPERTPELILESTGPGRPQRTSKQKALNQVKAWCGNISDVDEGGVKRAFSDSDSDSFEKKMKLEEESTDSEDERRPITVRKIIKTSLNGLGAGGKKPLPNNILIPDAHGVVRIDQKQLPALSSGVYVMSKTAGIIKLDSNTSKIATSGGHAVIKVAPKIGQTSIKVVKRDPANGSRPMIFNTKFKPGVKSMSTKVVAAPRKVPTVTAVVKKTVESVPMVIEEKIDEKEEEESDGLEELPFPTDMPLPEPESPPGEFTLCPLTGKIVGKDYNTASADDVKKTDPDGQSESIDNLVNMAAADILNEPGTDDASVKIEDTEVIEAKTRSIEETLSAMHGDEEVTVTTNTSATTSSILSTAISNADIENTPATSQSNVQKKALELTPATPEVKQQKQAMNRNVIGRTIVPKPAPQAIITRITPAVNRKAAVQKHHHPKVSSAGTPPPSRHSFGKAGAARQTYSNRMVVRKVGNSPLAAGAPAFKPRGRSPPPAAPPAEHPEVRAAVPGGTTTVINMPLLADIEPSTSAATEAAEQQASTSQPTEAAAQDEAAAGAAVQEADAPLLITGEDGTIYQVAGQNEEGQTILIAQDADGQQQCLLVTSESASDLTEAAAPVSGASAAGAALQEAVAVEPEQQEAANATVVAAEQDGDGAEDSQIVAQIVSAQPPSPGGTRKVVLMLPDGNLMMTEVTADQYAALELDK